MAKFSILNPLSRRKSAPNTVNFEGGRAFTQTAKLELVSVLLVAAVVAALAVLQVGRRPHG